MSAVQNMIVQEAGSPLGKTTNKTTKLPGNNLAGAGKVSLSVSGALIRTTVTRCYTCSGRMMQLDCSGWRSMPPPPKAYFDEVATATPVFGSADEDILMVGSREWHWHLLPMHVIVLVW